MTPKKKTTYKKWRQSPQKNWDNLKNGNSLRLKKPPEMETD